MHLDTGTLALLCLVNHASTDTRRVIIVDHGAASLSQLHLIASQYPESPTEETKRHAVGLIEGLAWFYPCAYCREDFREAIRQIPPRCVACNPGCVPLRRVTAHPARCYSGLL